MRDLASRVAIAVPLLAAVLAAAYFDEWWLFAVAVVAAVLALHELYTLIRPLRPLVLAGYAGVLAGLIGAQAGGVEWLFAGLLSTFIFAFGLYGVAETRQSGTVTIATTILGAMWIGAGIASLLLLRDYGSDHMGRLAIFTVLLTVFVNLRVGRASALTIVVVIVVALGPFLGARLNQQFSDQVGQVSATAGSSFLPQTVRYRIEVWRSEYAPLVMSHLLTGYGPGLPLRQLALYRDVVRNPAPEGRSASAGHLRRLDVCSVVAGQIAGVIVPSQPGRQVHRHDRVVGRGARCHFKILAQLLVYVNYL